MEAHELPPRLPDPGHDLDPIHPGSGRGDGLLKRIGATLAAIGLFIAKLGTKAKLLLVALPKLKLFTTSASMLVSIAAYQLIFGWLFSVGFVLLLLLHELGHVLPAPAGGGRRPRRRCSFPSWARSSLPNRWATTRARRRGWASPARSSARSRLWCR